MTDCCTHAIELCLRHDQPQSVMFTPYTYLSIPMLMHKLGIEYSYLDHAWQRWTTEYQFHNTRIWDSARHLERNMYRPGQMQCLSFGHGKPLSAGRGGAILLDDRDAYQTMIQQRYDGRDLAIAPWPAQQTFRVGYHYKPTIEEAVQALAVLQGFEQTPPKMPLVVYPDCREITITS
jgi:dTDP-4-amino-4,6-dideoxygalactose transaminase